ncbi:MAG TPA: thiol-disulfide oxidoreductase DCC family protein [Saprospiraceae bacterium]|nr:thiol-disulfide oxidoreductase DCC family protein [Saprospiraceae bacterium]
MQQKTQRVKEILEKSHHHPVLIYDGQCVLCNGFVQYVLKHDRDHYFLFATLQSKSAQYFRENAGKRDTVVLLDKGIFYTESDAGLRAARYLPFPHSWAQIFYIVPALLRNGIYRMIARNRYRWFGREDQCILPPPEHKSRFLDL